MPKRHSDLRIVQQCLFAVASFATTARARGAGEQGSLAGRRAGHIDQGGADDAVARDLA